MRIPAVFAVAMLAGPLAGAAGTREEADLLAQAGHARYLLAMHRARDGKSSSGDDLRRSIAALEESLAIDPTNLLALGYLGLARLASARRVGSTDVDVEAFAAAREPLEELFRLTRGWADPSTRAVLKEVAGVVQQLASVDENVRSWWNSWHPRLSAALSSPEAAGGSEQLFEAVRTSPVSYERADSIRRLLLLRPRPKQLASELGHALADDDSTTVRIAAARALYEVHTQGWDLRVAEALRRDRSAWVRRACADLLGRAATTGMVRPGKRARQALAASLNDDTPLVASVAAEALGMLGEYPHLLVDHLRSESSLVASACAHALSPADKDGDTLRTLVPLLADTDPQVRAAAALAVGPRAVAALEAEDRARVFVLLRDSDPLVRSAAARTAGGLGSASADLIVPLMSDPDPRVRMCAARAVVRLSSCRGSAIATLSSLTASPVAVRVRGGDLLTVGAIASRVLGEARE